MSNKVIKSVPVKQGLYEISSTANGDIGATMEFEDGRKFIYSLNGTDTLTPGAIIAGPVLSSYDEDIACAVTAVSGDTTISITTARSYTANELQDGWIYVGAGSGHLGHGRMIKSNPAADSAATLVITLYDALTDGITAGTDTLTIVENPYNGVMLNNSTYDGPIIGVAPCDVTASYYFWLQSRGPCPVVSGGACTVGLDLVPSSATCVVGDGTDGTIGRAMSTCDSGDTVLVDLNLT
jgi:hypothetical protein